MILCVCACLVDTRARRHTHNIIHFNLITAGVMEEGCLGDRRSGRDREIDLEEKTDVEEREGREAERSGEEDWCLERAPRAAVREKTKKQKRKCIKSAQFGESLIWET